MAATPEQLLALLEAPHWKTPGSTSRATEGPTGRRTEGQAAVNLTVVDHVAAGRRRLAAAEQAAAAGQTRRADALRRTQAAATSTLMGDTSLIRQTPCPACGTLSLLWRGGVGGQAVCCNLHCTPIQRPRRWTLAELMAAKPVRPRRRFHSGTIAARDLISLRDANPFFAETGKPASVETLRRLTVTYRLASWRQGQTLLFSRSDLLTAHALKLDAADSATCADRDDRQRPACAGMADLYGEGSDPAARRIDLAKQLCATCPLRAACLEQSLVLPTTDGVYGGLTAAERRDLLTTRKG